MRPSQKRTFKTSFHTLKNAFTIWPYPGWDAFHKIFLIIQDAYGFESKRNNANIMNTFWKILEKNRYVKKIVTWLFWMCGSLDAVHNNIASVKFCWSVKHVVMKSIKGSLDKGT